MKLRIFTKGFWENILKLNRTTNESSVRSEELDHVLQEQSPEPAKKPLQTEGIKTEETQESERKELTKTKVSETNDRSIVRSELNLEKNCIFTVSTYREKSREVTRREVRRDGEIVERRVIIGRTADGVETGILTTHHFKVYLALIELWERAGRPVGDKVCFTTLKLMNRLEMKDSGEEYRRLKRWVRNLRQTPITFVNSFYASGATEHTDLADVTILNHLHLYERKNMGRQKKTRGYGEFRFDDHIVENLINNHVHPLRLDVIKSFTKHRDLSILLYTYIDRNIAFRNSYAIGLGKLFGHLDLSQRHVKYPSDRKRVLDPVLEQLRGKELSTGILFRIEIPKTVDGKDYKLVCHKKPFPKKLKEQEEVPHQPELSLWNNVEAPENTSESTEADSELLPLLIEKGLTQKQASKLTEEKSSDVINDQLIYLPFRLREYKAQGKEINEAAILYESINDNWSIPKGYLGAEKEKEREISRIERERHANLEQEEREKAAQEKAEIEAYKKTLDPDERAKLRERALEQIRSMEGINEQFIGEPLIVGKENEILKSEMGYRCQTD